jgi:glycosyltransferase involved in cell wall biosynthesis
MKNGLSVIIPSRNEKYLEPTLRNILANARGDIEILVILDGWLPDPPIHMNDDRVIFFPFEESIGQRQGINYAAKKAKGKYMMKLDAHCAVDEGFDVKLAADCEYDWTVIPRMYNLDINTFKPKYHKRTDYMYMRVREDGQFRAEYYEGALRREMHRRPELIDDTMCCMGPCFYMHLDRFWELGGCDENHGGWGSQGIEVSCKAWLSGGALKVNKKTWFSHWFRGGGGPGFPYKISGRQVQYARNYAKNLWIGNNWPLAKRDFQWMVDKFNPPGWGKKGEKKKVEKYEIFKPANFRSHIYGAELPIAGLIQNIEHYCGKENLHQSRQYSKAVKFFKDLHYKKEFKTHDDLKAHPYYEYVSAGISGEKARLDYMRESIVMYHDIKANGMPAPLEFWVDNGEYVLSKGHRRLAILNALGKRHIALRIYKTKAFKEKLTRNELGVSGRITEIAKNQFRSWGRKATDKYWIHDYTYLYDLHCGYLKDVEAKVLEIGVQRGGSLVLWRDAFPKAQVYGVDIKIAQARFAKDQDRITLLEGSQVDRKFNKEQVIPLGPFDLIVDDASHRAAHQRKGLEILWGSVAPGGWYVVEDLYYRNYFSEKNPANMMAKLRDTIDEMEDNCDIEAMYFYYNICFIKKRNYEK